MSHSDTGSSLWHWQAADRHRDGIRELNQSGQPGSCDLLYNGDSGGDAAARHSGPGARDASGRTVQNNIIPKRT